MPSLANEFALYKLFSIPTLSLSTSSTTERWFFEIPSLFDSNNIEMFEGHSVLSMFRTGLQQLRSATASSTTSVSSILTTVRYKHEYVPRFVKVGKKHKGRVPVRTGGSIKGSTLQYGQFGLRLKSNGVRLEAIQLKEADNWLMRTMRANSGQLIRRLQTNIAVCVKGNETRMGKGKGAFDHWAVRVPTGKILFEINAPNLHEQVVRDTFRVAADKLPGVYEVVTLEDKPKAGFKTVDIPQKENIVAKMIANPTRRTANILKSKEDFFRMYRGR